MKRSKKMISDDIRKEIEARLVGEWSKERKNNFLKNREGSALNVLKIAEENNCSASTVYKILRKLKYARRWHSCQRRGRLSKLTTAGIRKVRRALKKGPAHCRFPNLNLRNQTRWTIKLVQALISERVGVAYSLAQTHLLYKNEFEKHIPENFRVKQYNVH